MKHIYYPLLLFMLGLIVPAFGQQFDVLVYTSPDRWHDPTVPTARAQFQEMAQKHDFNLAWAQKDGNAETTDPFTDEYLARFEVVVFLHSRGYDLSKKQMDSSKSISETGAGLLAFMRLLQARTRKSGSIS